MDENVSKNRSRRSSFYNWRGIFSDSHYMPYSSNTSIISLLVASGCALM